MKKAYLIITFFLLASCSDSGSFSCPAAKDGKKCLTIAESDVASYKKSNKENPILKDKFKGSTIAEETSNTSKISNIPVRSEEKVGRIWFSPFVDTEGNLFDESYVYVVFKPSSWGVNSK